MNFNKLLGSICSKKKMDGRKEDCRSADPVCPAEKRKTILWVIQPLTASEEDHDIKRRNHTRKQTIRN